MIFCAQDLIYVVFIVTAHLIYGFVTKKQWTDVIRFGLTLFIAFVVNEFVRSVFPSHRPFDHLRIHQLIAHDVGKSFPSNHMVAASSIAFATLTFKKRAGIPLLILSLFIGFSRIYVGVHYPSDILAGFVIGIVSTIVVVGIWHSRALALKHGL